MNMFGSDDPTRWDRAIDILTRGGWPAHVPLLEAGKAGVMELVYTSNRTASLPFGRIRRAAKPLMILVGDDDDAPTGPAGWKVARQITSWARGAIVHGSGAERAHYEIAVAGTLVCQRFLVVDTASRFIPAWMALLGHVQALAIMPKDGPHPVAEPKATMH